MTDSDGSQSGDGSSDLESYRKRLAETRRQLRLLEELAHVGSWRIDVINEELHWSEQVFAIHGLSPEAFVPTVAKAIERYHPDDRETVRQSVARAVEDKQPFDFELRLIRADGEVRQVIAKGRPEQDADGRVYSVVGIFQDVTTQRLADAERHRSLERLRVHMEHTPLGVVEWDGDFRVVEWNARCEEIFGYTREEALGQRGVELIVPESVRPSVSDVFAELLEQRGGWHNTNDNVTKDGRVITCDWYNTVLVGEDGRPNGVASICQDISGRRQLEAQVVQYQKMEAIGTLAGGIAHDINNVLAVVLGLGSLLLEDLPDGPMRTDVEEIIAAAERGGAMVKSLLDFARQEQSEVTRWSPGAAIQRLVGLLEKTVSKSVAIRTEVDDDVADVIANRNQMSTALMNVCINASQAMPDRGTIRLSARNARVGEGDWDAPANLHPGLYVCIRVEDDGTGMDEVTRARAFEPFFTTKDVGQGTGLGLAMVYSTVERHQGRVTIDSAPGHGTTVSIYLPAADQPVQLGDDGKRGVVLVIDDERMILNSARRMLEKSGYAALCAQGGFAGLEVYEANAAQIDVVLLDLSMPRLDGLECLERLLAIDPNAKVVICTGHGGPRHTERMLQAGARAVLNKPFSRKALAEIVGEVAG